MTRTKTLEITITDTKKGFNILKKPSANKENFDFKGVSTLRNLLSNEKARILNVIKNHKPKSIYELAKILGRGFKTVNDDIKLLERIGFIELVEEKTKKRIRYKPEIVVDKITIHFEI